MLIQDMEECWRSRVGCAVTVQCIVASSIIFRSYSDWARPPWRSTPPAAAWAAPATSGSLQQWTRHVSDVSMEEGEHRCEISYHLVDPLLNFLAVIIVIKELISPNLVTPHLASVFPLFHGCLTMVGMTSIILRVDAYYSVKVLVDNTSTLLCQT